MKKVTYEDVLFTDGTTTKKGFAFYVVFAESEWEIQLPVVHCLTEEEAEKMREIDITAILSMENKKPCILIFMEEWLFSTWFDENIIIRTLKKDTEEKLKKEPFYPVEDKDLEESDMTLSDLITRYHLGYELDYMGYQIKDKVEKYE